MSSIGKDLVTIRTHLGFTIQDIQNATKIPLNTLKAIESGSIFEQSEEIKTYVRSFVRSYGRAIKLKDELVVSALDQQETGNYNHILLEQFPELSDRVRITPTDPREPASEKTDSDESKSDDAEKSDTDLSSRFVADFPEETTEEEKTEFKPAPPPGVRSVNWADMGKRFSSETPKTPAWIVGAIFVLLVALAASYYLFQNDFFMSDEISVEQPAAPEQQVQPESNGNQLSLSLADTPSGETENTGILDDVLYLTVYAATDRLDPVRVWSDLKPRMDPYWMEGGIAFNFEFRDTIRVRGQYSRMLLFMNGHLIENFRQQHFNPQENAVELTRSLFEEDQRWANPVALELPPNVPQPDSVTNRPTF